MALTVPAAIAAVAKMITKALDLISPERRARVRKTKALNFGEKFILHYLELLKHANVVPHKEKEKQVGKILKEMDYYRNWFFDYNN